MKRILNSEYRITDLKVKVGSRSLKAKSELGGESALTSTSKFAILLRLLLLLRLLSLLQLYTSTFYFNFLLQLYTSTSLFVIHYSLFIRS